MSNVEKERDRISFRLRNIDADLRKATMGLTSDTLSDLARDGLRLILGIRTTQRVEVAERPISLPPIRTEESAQQPITLRSKPAVYVPQPQRKGGDHREVLRN